MSGVSQVKLGVVLSYITTVSQAVINLAYVPLLLAALGQEEYGLYQLIGSIISYLNVMATVFNGGVTRFYCKYYAENDIIGMENTLAIARRIFNVLGVVVMLIGGIGGIAFGNVYSRTLTEYQVLEGRIMLLMLSINVIVMMHNTIDLAVISAHERFSFQKSAQLVTIIVQPVAVLTLVAIMPSAWTITLVQLAINVLCAAIQRLYARVVLKARSVLHSFDKKLASGLLKFTLGILWVFLADQVLWRTNQLFVGFYFGASAVAVYAVATQIYSAYMSIGTAVSSVFMPKISNLYHSKHDIWGISELFIKVGRLAAYPLCAVLMGFGLFGRSFIGLWVGKGYDQAYLIALIIMVPFTVDLCQNIGITILQVMNKYYFRGGVYMAMAAANIALAFLVVPKYGSVGVAFCTGTIMLIGNGPVMNRYYAKKIGLNIREYWAQLFRVTFPGMLFALIVALVQHLLVFVPKTWPELVSCLTLFIIGYSMVTYLFSMNEYEKSMIKGILLRLAPWCR